MKILFERVFEAIQRIVDENDGKTVVIATHATPIRTLCCRMKGLPVEELKNVPWVSNASITVLEVNEGNFSMVQEDYNEYLSDLQTRFPANV